MTKKIAPAKEFAQQLLNPLTKSDFELLYNNATTEIEKKFGEQFAVEAAYYSATKLDGSIINIVTNTNKLMAVLSPLNDEHFKIAFDYYVSDLSNFFSNSGFQEKLGNVQLDTALNAFSHAVSHVERPYVKEFLFLRNYQVPENKNTTP